MRRALFVADEHVPNRVLQHGVVGGQNRAAGIAEHVGDALAHERFPQNLCAGQFHKSLTESIAACQLLNEFAISILQSALTRSPLPATPTIRASRTSRTPRRCNAAAGTSIRRAASPSPLPKSR